MAGHTGSLLRTPHRLVAVVSLTHQASTFPGCGVVLSVRGHKRVEALLTSGYRGEISTALIN